MPRRYRSAKYRKPPLSTYSSIPVIWMTPETVNLWNQWIQAPDRLERGMELVTMEACKIVHEEIVAKAPDLADALYPKRLKVSLLDGSEGFIVVIWFEDTQRDSDGATESDTAYLIELRDDSPRYAQVLAKWGPWPADMFPMSLDEREATVIARRATSIELNKLRDRVVQNARKIEMELRNAGAKGVEVPSTKSAKQRVVDDIGFSVLRAEYGINTRPQPHWRPAIRSLSGRVKDLGTKLEAYLLDGKENRFELPNLDSGLSTAGYRQGIWFQEKIAPSL